MERMRTGLPPESYGSCNACHDSYRNTGEAPSKRRASLKFGAVLSIMAGVACLAVCSSVLLLAPGTATPFVMIQGNTNAVVAAADKKAMASWEKSIEGVMLWGELSGGVEQALDAPWPWDEAKTNAAKTPSLKQKKPLSAKQAAQLKHNNLIAAQLEAKSQKVGGGRKTQCQACTICTSTVLNCAQRCSISYHTRT
jgi:hypothetical protein